MKPATSATVALLVAIAVLHLARLAFGVEVMAGGTTVPLWVSAVGVVVPGALAAGVWREHRPGR